MHPLTCLGHLPIPVCILFNTFYIVRDINIKVLVLGLDNFQKGASVKIKGNLRAELMSEVSSLAVIPFLKDWLDILN